MADSVTRGTRIMIGVIATVIVTLMAAFIVFAAVGWSTVARERADLQSSFEKQVNRNDVLQDEYNKLYREYRDATGKVPSAPSPSVVRGQNGAQGPRGDMGVPGQTGPKGDLGPQGPQGATGAPGATGATGAAGQTGATGATGADGAQGPQGATGPAGPPGPGGPAGANGSDGRGIQSISCDGDGATSVWNITYTDGSTVTVAGPCRVSILP